MKQAKRCEPTLNRMLLMMMFGGVISVAQSSYASPITFEFAGKVIDVSEYANSFGGLNVNDSFFAQFVFETTSDLLPEDPINGRYSALSASLEIPSLSTTQPGGVLDIANDVEFDSLTFASSGGDFTIRAVFKGASAALSSDAMPVEFPLMENTHVLNVFAASGDKFAGTITSAIITPEPTVLAMILVGLHLMARRHAAT